MRFLPVINKVGGSVDRVNAQLDKLDTATDSAVDAVEAVDEAVRSRQLRGQAAGAEARRSVTPASSHGWASLRTRRNWREAVDEAKAAAARRERDLDEELKAHAMADEITLTLPREPDFHRVAHLVLGGLAVRINLTIENLEDLQIALDSLLGAQRRRAGQPITVRMALRDGALETASARCPRSVLDEVEREQGDELGLRRVLESTVDDVHVDGDSVRLTKKVSRADGLRTTRCSSAATTRKATCRRASS